MYLNKYSSECNVFNLKIVFLYFLMFEIKFKVLKTSVEINICGKSYQYVSILF